MSSSARLFKEAVYGQLARIGKAVSNPKRLELIDLLCQGPHTVEALAKQAEISVANCSQHLQVLRAARILDAEKRGLHVIYRLADDDVAHFFCELRSLAESRLAELEQISRRFLAERESTEPVPSEELLRRVRAGEVTVLDVRPADEYRAGHIPGAISVPLPELKKRLSELSRDREIVAYCRGPYCVMALDAVELLREKGFQAHRMEQGVTDWRARGWRVDTAAEDTVTTRRDKR